MYQVWLPIIILATTAQPQPALGKGIGVPPENQRCEAHLLNVEWWHSWTPFNEMDCSGRHIPMVWGPSQVDCVITNDCQCYFKSGVCPITHSDVWIFANEPNAYSQSNWQPKEAAAAFDRLAEALPDVRWIVGNLLPCEFNPGDCTMPEREWLDRFLAEIEHDGAVWAIGVHSYRWSGCDYDPVHLSEYGYPVIVTEVARPGDLDCYPALKSQLDASTAGYAFFASYTGTPWFSRANMVDERGVLTELGQWYKNE